MTDIPTPMTPPDCDLRGYDYMPLFGHHMFASETFLECSDEEFRAALRLWWMAWLQKPAASLPDSDRTLADYAGYGRDVDAWLKVKPNAMRGFVKCSDDRFYHSFLAPKAVEAYELRLKRDTKRETDRERLKTWREAQKKHAANKGAKQGPSDDGTGGETPNVTPLETQDETRFAERVETPSETQPDTPTETRFVAGRKERKGKEEGTDPNGSDAPSFFCDHRVSGQGVGDIRGWLWSDGAAIVQRLTGKSRDAAKGMVGKWLKQTGDDCPAVMRALLAAADTRPIDAKSWITAAIQARNRAEGAWDWIKAPGAPIGPDSDSCPQFDLESTAEDVTTHAH